MLDRPNTSLSPIPWGKKKDILCQLLVEIMESGHFKSIEAAANHLKENDPRFQNVTSQSMRTIFSSSATHAQKQQIRESKRPSYVVIKSALDNLIEAQLAATAHDAGCLHASIKQASALKTAYSLSSNSLLVNYSRHRDTTLPKPPPFPKTLRHILPEAKAKDTFGLIALRSYYRKLPTHKMVSAIGKDDMKALLGNVVDEYLEYTR